MENRAKSDEKRGLWGVVRLFVKPTHVAMVLRHGWGTRICFSWRRTADATGYGKAFNKELFSPAVVPVVAGKVEIWRITLLGLELGLGLVLENRAVELRASGKVGNQG